MTTPFLTADLKRDEDAAHVEGEDFRAFRDTVGVWTIGYGHADVEPGLVWTQAQADAALAADIAHAERLLDAHAAWWRGLDDPRQDVMVQLCFNMGWGDGTHGLSSFHHTLEAIRLGLFNAAAEGLLASKWAGQVKGRARRLAEQLRTGVRAAS